MATMQRRRMAGLVWGLVLGGGLVWTGLAGGEPAEEEPKSNRMLCEACPEGYATTGITSAPEACKDADEPLLYQCVPLGARLLAVCGSCPEGYATVGTSMVPSRCTGEDNGLMSQCQLQESP